MASRNCRSCEKPLERASLRCPDCGAWGPIRGIASIQMAAIIFLGIIFIIAVFLLMSWSGPGLPVR